MFHLLRQLTSLNQLKNNEIRKKLFDPHAGAGLAARLLQFIFSAAAAFMGDWNWTSIDDRDSNFGS